MNSFIKGIENHDASAVAERLYMPQDKDGSGRKALAADYLVGFDFIRTLQSKLNKQEADQVCFGAASCNRSHFVTMLKMSG